MTIVAAVDSSDHAPGILSAASVLARDLEEPLHAVHVLQRTTFVDALEKNVEGQPLADNYEIRRIGEEIVERGTADPDVPHSADTVEIELRIGDPATETTSYARSVGARYLVIGGRRRSPTGKALFGSVTQKIMFDASMPVLTVPLDKR